MENKFDIVIIGAGVSGLHLGAILALKGKKVCLLEKHSKIGGGLHNFTRNRLKFESGIHYTSSLGKGQILNKLYQYLGILDRLKIEKMDDAGFDSVLLDNDPKEYRLAASKEKFIHNLITFFPDEKEAIEKYYTDVKRASRQTEFHNLSNNMSEITVKSSLSDYLDQLTDNEKLKYALAGNNFCYGGMKGITSFHMHALVMDSYFDGAYRFIDGSQQLANELRRIILKNGGLVEKNARVTGIQLNEEKKVQSVQTRHKTYSADFCVSTINPQTTLDLLPSEAFKPYYRRKIESYDNTLSCFTLFIEFEENQFPYYNRNFYYVKDGNLWPDENSIQEEWPINYYFATPPHPEQGKYAKTAVILAYMRYDEVREWENQEVKHRDESYQQFKKKKAEILLNKLSEKFPQIKHSIKFVEMATPLTVKHYLGTQEGGMYGLTRKMSSFSQSFIHHRTTIPNLFLCGQSTYAHGLVGCVMSALIVSGEFIDRDLLFEEINKYD